MSLCRSVYRNEEREKKKHRRGERVRTGEKTLGWDGMDALIPYNLFNTLSITAKEKKKGLRKCCNVHRATDKQKGCVRLIWRKGKEKGRRKKGRQNIHE